MDLFERSCSTPPCVPALPLGAWWCSCSRCCSESAVFAQLLAELEGPQSLRAIVDVVGGKAQARRALGAFAVVHDFAVGVHHAFGDVGAFDLLPAGVQHRQRNTEVGVVGQRQGVVVDQCQALGLLGHPAGGVQVEQPGLLERHNLGIVRAVDRLAGQAAFFQVGAQCGDVGHVSRKLDQYQIVKDFFIIARALLYGDEFSLAQRDHIPQLGVAGLALAVPTAVYWQRKQAGLLGGGVKLHPAHKAGVVAHVFRLAGRAGNGCAGVVGLAIVQRALEEAVELAAGHIDAQPLHATVGAALGEDGSQIGCAGAGLVFLLDDAGGRVDLHDEGAVFVGHPQRIACCIHHHGFGVQAEFAVALGIARIGEGVVQNLFARVACDAARLYPAIGVLCGAELDRQGRDELGAILAERDHADGRREVGRWKHRGTGEARGVGAVGDLRDRAGGGVRAAVGDGVELQRAVGAPALQGQARTVGRQKALGEIGLGGGMFAFIGEIELVVELDILARDDGADAADASRLRDGLGACDLERTGVGAGAQQGDRSGSRCHQAEGRIEVAHGGYRGYGGRRRWKAKKTGPAGQGPVPRWRFATKRRWRRSERVADAQVHTARAGIGNTRGAADQADAGTVLVADVRHTSVQRGALGQVVDISDRILVGLAAAAREGGGISAEFGASVLDAEIARAQRQGAAQVEAIDLAGCSGANGFPLQAVVSAAEHEAAEVVRSAQCQVVQVAGCGNGAGGGHRTVSGHLAVADAHVQRAGAVAQATADVLAGLACAGAGSIFVTEGCRQLAVEAAQVAGQQIAHGVADARAIHRTALAGGVVGCLADGLEQVGLHAGGGVRATEGGEDVVAGGVVATQADFTPGLVGQSDGGAALESQRAAAATGTSVGVEAAFEPELSLVAAAEVFLAAETNQAGLALAGVQCIESVAAGLGAGDADVHHAKNGDGRLCQGQAGSRCDKRAHHECQGARARFLSFHCRDTN